MAESLAHIPLTAFIALSWLGAGTIVLRRWGRVEDVALDTLNRLALGAVAFALATAWLGWLGLLYRWLFLPLFVVTAVVGLREAFLLVRVLPRPTFRRWPRVERALVALLVVYVLLAVVGTMAPISSPDALFYHAAGPALFAHDHRLVEMPWSWQSYQPFNVEMLVLDGMLLWNPIQGAFAALLLSLGAGAAVLCAAYRLAGRRVALLATAIFVAQPFFIWEATSTFVEGGLALMTLLAAWNLARFRSSGRVTDAALAGACAGAAAGMKYVGLAAAAVLAAAGLVLAWRRLRPRAIAAFATAAVLVPLSWYVKNAIVTGNPLFPLYFGGANPEATAAMKIGLDAYGRGRSLRDAVLLPVRLLTSGSSFDRGDFVSPLFLGLAPAALLVRRYRVVVAVILAGAAAYVAAWFVGSQQARFLIPLMPPFAILAALGANEIARRTAIGRFVVVASVAATLVAGAAVSVVYSAQFVPVALGLQSKDAFLSHKASYYDGFVWLDRHLPPGAVVVTDIPSGLYLRPPYVVRTREVLPDGADRAATSRFLRRWHVDYIAFVRGDAPLVKAFTPFEGRLVGSVPVHYVTSRTLNEIGAPDRLLVWQVRK